MQDPTTRCRVLVTAAIAAFLSAEIGAQAAASAPGDTVTFAAPVRLMAGDAFMGQGRLYPSPAVRDMNGDGFLDVVVGDLSGRVTVAYGKSDGTFGPDENLLKADGKPLKFHNW